MKPGGALYPSFRFDTHEGMRKGSWFTDITEVAFGRLTEVIDGVEIVKFNITLYVCPCRSGGKWLNVWYRWMRQSA